MTPDIITRRLYVVDIVHDPKDMGLSQGRMRVSEEYKEAAAEYWANVGESISGLEIDRAYQDGLPDVPEQQVDMLVDQVKTPNYEILAGLNPGVL